MTKFSFIIPFYGNPQDYNFKYCIESLLRQRFKDFEIIICGNKIQDTTIQYLNNIKIINIVMPGNNISKLINNSIKFVEGDFIHVWCSDLIVYPDYLECLNDYISKYGENNLYAGHLIDMRGLQFKEKRNDGIYFKTFDTVEGYSCCYKKYFEPFREEFEGGFATHCFQEHCYRLWKKIKFIYMYDIEVVHIPHPMRISYDDSIITSQKSFLLFEKMKHGEI